MTDQDARDKIRKLEKRLERLTTNFEHARDEIGLVVDTRYSSVFDDSKHYEWKFKKQFDALLVKLGLEWKTNDYSLPKYVRTKK